MTKVYFDSTKPSETYLSRISQTRTLRSLSSKGRAMPLSGTGTHKKALRTTTKALSLISLPKVLSGKSSRLIVVLPAKP